MSQPVFSTRLQFQDYKFDTVLPVGVWRWTTRVNVAYATPSYEIRDISSPFGRLEDMIPIPSPVITAMAESITQLQQAFSPSILLSTSSLTFTTNQGQGVTMPQPVTISNNGSYGSLLSTTLSSSASWLQTTPANISGLAANESGSTNVTADSSALYADSSPYTATLTVQDPSARNNPQVINVTVNVLPPAFIQTSVSQLTFTIAAPFFGQPYPPIPSQQFILTNSGPTGSQLTYLVQKLIGNSPWLVSFNPFMGNLASSQTQAVTIAVAPPMNMLPGTYNETLRVSGFSTNMIQDVAVQLIIT